ncbi:MAG: MFS transporter [Bryobacteraceae bacterium]
MRTSLRVRWWIVWTLFLSTVINYLNRQTLSVLAPVISKEFHLSHTALSHIFGSFQFAYAGSWLIGGVLLDIIGPRIGLALAVIFWSLVSIATAFANSVASFTALRFLLGIGEGFNWPGASKVVAEWFPARERGVAVAIFDSGSSIGGAVAALAIPLIALAWGWRQAFIVSGVLGFLWLGIWLWAYYPLRSHPRVSPEEVALIGEGAVTDGGATKTGWRQSIEVLKTRNAWGILLGRSLTDPTWWFYVFWLPQYLSDVRHFNLKQIAAFAWIPFVAADIGNFTGGWLSGLLIRRGIPVMRSRKLICIASCIPMLAGIPAALVSDPYWALALICFALWGYASWSTMGLTFPSDLFPPEVVGAVTGLSGFGAGLAGTGVTLLVGWIVDRFSYVPAFVILAIAPVVATICVLLLIRQPASQPVLATPADL